jgi:hypothetical protein
MSVAAAPARRAHRTAHRAFLNRVDVLARDASPVPRSHRRMRELAAFVSGDVRAAGSGARESTQTTNFHGEPKD